jgi:AraC-like DNA-binding protein
MMFVRIIVCFLIAVASFSSAEAQVTFVIDQLPKTTPSEDTLFIAGTFNVWKLKDPAFMLKKRLDGKYFITLPAGRGAIEYKFNRGSWTKCETDLNNNYKPNRIFSYGNGTIVSIVIENWQDAGGARSFDMFIFYFFATALLAVITAFFIHRIKGRRKKEGRIVIGFLIYLSIVLLGRVMYEISPMAWQLKLELMGDVLLLLSGPAWLLVLSPEKFSKRFIYIHGIPAATAAFLIALKLANFSALSIITAPLANPLFTIDRFIFLSAALISNITYLGIGLLSVNVLRPEHSSLESRYAKNHLLLGISFTLILIGKLFPFLFGDEALLSWFNLDVLFLGVSAFPILHAYYVFKHEEIFKSGTPARIPEANQLMTVVHEVMLQKKCFCDPNLTLNQLSEVVNIKPHLLSRIINECYHQNFRDFVNKYRVEEFVKLARQQTNRRYTFLALANEVGFNSKSTFNVAFKKVLQQSPREFLKANKILDRFKKDEESLVL